MRFKKGDKVKMSQSLKDGLIASDCKEHADEFGDCVGIVGGKMFPQLTWQEDDAMDIYWQPSNLRYGYSPNELVRFDDTKKIRKKKLDKLNDK